MDVYDSPSYSESFSQSVVNQSLNKKLMHPKDQTLAVTKPAQTDKTIVKIETTKAFTCS